MVNDKKDARSKKSGWIRMACGCGILALGSIGIMIEKIIFRQLDFTSLLIFIVIALAGTISCIIALVFTVKIGKEERAREESIKEEQNMKNGI